MTPWPCLSKLFAKQTMGCISSEPTSRSSTDSQYEVGGTTAAIEDDLNAVDNNQEQDNNCEDHVETSENRALKIFNRLDADDDGGIDKEELSYFYMNMGYCQCEAKRRAIDDRIPSFGYSATYLL